MTATGKILGFVGPKGSGKTTGALRASAGERRIIRYDLNYQPEMEAGAVAIHGRAGLAEYILSADGRARHKVCFRDLRGWDENQDGFEFANRAAIAWGGCAVLWDEAETLLNKHKAPAHAGRIIRTSRHVKVNLYWTAQLPANVAPTLRGNTDEIYFFPGFDNTYLEFVEKMLGRDAVKAMHEVPPYTPIIHKAGQKWTVGKKFSQA